MVEQKFTCRNCGKKFVIDVLEPGEAEERRVRPVPVRCPQCGSTNLEKS